MTKMQRRKEFIREQLDKVFVQDRFGHYKHGRHRIKMMKRLFRFEVKTSGGWLRLASVEFMHIDDTSIIQPFINQMIREQSH
jgi:hypothetical protein